MNIKKATNYLKKVNKQLRIKNAHLKRTCNVLTTQFKKTQKLFYQVHTQLLLSLLKQNFKPCVVNQLGTSFAAAFRALFRLFATTSLFRKLSIKFPNPIKLTDDKNPTFYH